MLTTEQIQQMADIIAERFQPEKIILFGSYATGTATDDSDVDLLVIEESDLPRYKRAVPLYRALCDAPASVDIVVFTPAEVDEWRNVQDALVTRAANQGRMLYEKTA